MGLANKIPGSDPVPGSWFPSGGAVGLYVHVPFCAHTCDFCAFYQVEPRRGDIDRYLQTIASEMALVAAPARLDTAFWGGGTPGLLSPRDLERLGRLQLDRFGEPAQEWTVELAPGSVKRDKLQVLRDLGVTRVSLGAQSFQERTLEELGRRHSLAQIHRAWELIGDVGFPSRNLDLIFAVPGQTLAEWSADLRAATSLGPDHLSTYCLTFEEDTALYVRLSAGRVAIDAERERSFYEATWDILPAAGLRQYEISNHARPGHESRHNLNTWRMQEWIGLGPSAASQQAGWRGTNPSDLDAWEQGIALGARATMDRLPLSAGQLVEDAIIFGLRMNAGVALGELEARFGTTTVAPFRPLLASLVAEDLAVWSGPQGDTVALTRAGRLVADAVGAEMIGLGTA